MRDFDWLGDRTNLMQYALGEMVCEMVQRYDPQLDDTQAARATWNRIEFWHDVMPDLTVDQVLRLIIVVQQRDETIRREEERGGHDPSR